VALLRFRVVLRGSTCERLAAVDANVLLEPVSRCGQLVMKFGVKNYSVYGSGGMSAAANDGGWRNSKP
jgi:hypothetical protein